MHAALGKDKELTDSMKIFQLGLEGGRPEPGSVGAVPEWFYKGTGTMLRAHGEALDIPCYAEDGGEEAEIAGIYLVDREGRPRRLGLSEGNEFSDHSFERKNYLDLAASKLRSCALGPELVLDPEFQSVAGKVAIERAGAVLWLKQIRTGEAEMCHSLPNIEHHHFKFEAHRRPGDVHVHFFGADCLSFGDGIRLQNDDVIEVRFEKFGRPAAEPSPRCRFDARSGSSDALRLRRGYDKTRVAILGLKVMVSLCNRNPRFRLLVDAAREKATVDHQ